MKIALSIFYPILLISFVLCAEVDKVTFESLQSDEIFFSETISVFLGIRDLLRASSVCKSLLRIIRNRIMSLVTKDFDAFVSNIKSRNMPPEALNEFEFIWKITRLSEEQKAIKRQSELRARGQAVEMRQIFKPINIDIFFDINSKYKNLHFPALTLGLLKTESIDVLFKKKLIPKIFSKPELYNESLHVLAKEIFKCKRNQLPLMSYKDNILERSETYPLITYNHRENIRITMKHSYSALAEISRNTFAGLALINVFGQYTIVLYSILIVYLTLGLKIIYYLFKNCRDEYENFK